MEPTEELVLRRAESADLSVIAGLYWRARQAAKPAMPPLIRTEEEVVAHVASWDLRAGSVPAVEREVWVACPGGEAAPAGYAVLDQDWLDGLYVDPELGRRGVGTVLLDLVKAIRPQGFGLWVFATNRPARDFYAVRGLVELETTDGSESDSGVAEVRMVWPGTNPMRFLREQIDVVDDQLAGLLARRFALTAAVQDHKASGGHVGRDDARERQIVERMARLAPGVDPEAIGRIVHALISEGLACWETRRRNNSADVVR